MSFRTLLRDFCLAAIVLTVLPVTALAQPVALYNGPAGPEPVQTLPPGSIVLYDQTLTPIIGITSQVFGPGFEPFDSQATDDFFVTDPGGWIVTQVNVLGSYGSDLPGGETVPILQYRFWMTEWAVWK
jgi:hypothetical protein